MKRPTKTTGQLQRCVMQVGYVTTQGTAVAAGEIHQGLQSHAAGPVEITLRGGERVCFSARECGLPVPELPVEDLAA